MRTPVELASLLALALVLVVTGCGDRRQCAIDADCPLGATCAAGGDCRAAACAVDRDCPLGALCEAGGCRPGCRDALDCPLDAAVCDTAAGVPGTCVGCRGDTDCPDPLSCVDRICRQACRDDQNCATGHCDTASRWCVECTADSHCGTGTVCRDQDCVAGCIDDTGCASPTPRCAPDQGSDGVCVQCRSDADCAAGPCSSGGTCDGPPPAAALDILMVIDNSQSMLANQAQLVASFPAFIDELEIRAGVRPDLHIGIISTDMGIGSAPVANCTDVGDAGVLIKRDECVLSDGSFLRDVAVAGGLRDANYTGTLAEAFSCMASLGVGGCGFEQPLASIKAALEPGANPGFRRLDAGLVVIILTNEDDCSAADPRLYSPAEDGTFGRMSSYRCFEHGIRCEPDSPREVGDKQGCVPRATPLLHPVDGYVSFLRQQVFHDRLVVGLIAGPEAPVAVQLDENAWFDLAPSCELPVGGGPPIAADPAIRLHAFGRGLGSQAVLGSACDENAGPMRAVAAAAAALLP